jgi:hypothetical protein
MKVAHPWIGVLVLLAAGFGCGSSSDGAEEDGTGDVAAEDAAGEDAAADAGNEDAVADVPEEDGAGEDAADADEDAADAEDAPGDSTTPPGPIVADHTIVDRYDDVPGEYLDRVKAMWFNLLGESHSASYQIGLRLLSEADARFPASVTEGGAPEAPRTDALRASRHRRTEYSSWAQGAGEAIWYTNDAGRAQLAAHIDYCEANGLHIAAIGFGWCWDMTWHNTPGGEIDPVFQVRWAGASEGGPDGDLRWGLDAEDFALTGNRVSMDTYLSATQAFADHCDAEGHATRVLFTTGPVDGYSGESGYQRQVKHDHIRRYVRADPDRILFDYADILAWSDAGVENVQTWTDGSGGSHAYQMIHADNMRDLDGGYEEDGDHIGEAGALRLAKAVWWLLARIAGWDGD